MKAASGAAAATLKCPIPRVTSAGLHANATPASHDSGTRRVTWRASRNAMYAVSTDISRYTTLNVATTPRTPTSGSATRFWKVV